MITVDTAGIIKNLVINNVTRTLRAHFTQVAVICQRIHRGYVVGSCCIGKLLAAVRARSIDLYCRTYSVATC